MPSQDLIDVLNQQLNREVTTFLRLRSERCLYQLTATGRRAH